MRCRDDRLRRATDDILDDGARRPLLRPRDGGGRPHPARSGRGARNAGIEDSLDPWQPEAAQESSGLKGQFLRRHHALAGLKGADRLEQFLRGLNTLPCGSGLKSRIVQERLALSRRQTLDRAPELLRRRRLSS